MLPINLIGQDSLSHIKFLDSTLNISDKGLAIELLKEKVFKLGNTHSYIKGLYYLRIGRIYGNQHQLKLGEDYYRKGLQIGLKLNNDRLLSQGYLGVGGIQLIDQLHDPKNATYDSIFLYFEKALPHLIIENDKKNIEGLNSNIELILINLGEIDSAKSLIKNTLKKREENDDKIGVLGSLNNIALLYRKSKNYNEAEKYYIETFNLAKSDSLLNQMTSAKLGLARLFMEKGEFHKSLSNFLEYDSLNKLSLNAEFQKQIANSETKFKTAEIERDNALKQAEIEENRRQLLLLYAFSFLLILASVSTYLFFNQRRKRQKIASEKAIQDLLQSQEMKTTYALLEGQDKERKRIAAELHDNLGSILVTLNMYADTLQNKKPKDIPALAQKIADVAQLANTETRKISHSLDSGMLRHFGLEAAIKQLTEAVSSARKIKFNLSIQTGEISSEASIEIYRIIQELVNNTLKHAQCTKVHLELTHVDHSFSIIYEDNGIGFNPKEASGGMGLKNIQNRAERLDGELTIDSTPGKGSSFIIEIPHL
ncbi:ATP-binding protein [Ekhidna sp.]|uniref:tetratricopeptide repeat-containing sensor histidine kinase n=1 Tax=Ekhidna sp. TaxID=2608089 RepID=UPI0032EDCA85